MVIVGFLQGISGYGPISKFHETNSMVQNHTIVFDMQRILHFLVRAFHHCPVKEQNRCLNAGVDALGQQLHMIVRMCVATLITYTVCEC